MGLFLALVIAAMALLSAANRAYGRQTVERQAAQASSLLQSWVGGGSAEPPAGSELQGRVDPRADLPDVMPKIRGFSVFDKREQPVFSWGDSVPSPNEILGGNFDISPQPFGDVVAWGGGSAVFYLKTEPVMPRQRMMGMNGPGERLLQDQPRMPRQGGITLVLSYDGSEALGVMRIRQFLITALGLAAIGLLVALLWLFRRIQRLQSDLEDHRALARLGTAARTLAHEIRNPLSIILMQAKLLERQVGPEHADGLRSICEEADRIELQVRNVKKVLGQGEESALENGRPAFSGSPVEWLSGLEAGLPMWKGKVIITGSQASMPGAVLALTGDSLRSIVVNLVDNALEAYGNDENGPVSVEWNFRGGRKPLFLLVVRDQAGGVKRELRRSIFDPFFTTKPQGSGVGLNLARELARSAGGDLRYGFEPPSGSRFTLTVPMLPGHAIEKQGIIPKKDGL